MSNQKLLRKKLNGKNKKVDTDMSDSEMRFWNISFIHLALKCIHQTGLQLVPISLIGTSDHID